MRKVELVYLAGLMVFVGVLVEIAYWRTLDEDLSEVFDNSEVKRPFRLPDGSSNSRAV